MRSGGRAVSCAWRGQRFQDARGEAGARVPDLDRNECMTRAVVISKPPWDALADDIVGLPGREPGDVCI